MSRKVRELRSLIFAKFDTEAEFAKEINWSRQKLNKITNGQREPDINDLNDLSKGLGISVGELAHIFLRHKSPNEQQSA